MTAARPPALVPEAWLACPVCRATGPDGALPQCGHPFRRDDTGIYRLTDDRAFYFREKMPREVLRRIIDEEDLLSACYRAFKQELGWKYDFYALDQNRGAAALLSALGPETVALDYGSGWGTVTRFAAQHARHLFSMDLTYESLRFCHRTGPANITCLHGGDSGGLPFRDGVLDLVILNGVLEWIPQYRLEGPPRQVQVAFLREVKRVLKPGGQVLIAIENRFGLDYFRGRRDEHTGIRYITVLPRFLADRLSRRRRNEPYRALTHGRSGYRRLLADAGLGDVDFAVPKPDYREIRQLLPRDRGPVAGTLGERIATRLVTRMPHSYVVLSNASRPSLLERLLARHGEDYGDVLEIRNRNARSQVWMRTPRRLYKLPGSAHAAEGLKAEAERLETLGKNPELAPFLPEMTLLHEGGNPVQVLPWVQGDGRGWAAGIAPFLALQERQARAGAPAVLAPTARLALFLALNDRQPLLEAILERLGGEPLPCALAHGQLTPAHILVTDREVTLLEWSFFSDAAPVGVDLLGLALHVEKNLSGRRHADLADDLLGGRLSLSPTHPLQDREAALRRMDPRIGLFHLVKRLDDLLGRYPHPAFIPFVTNRDLLATVEAVARFVTGGQAAP